MSMDNNNEGNLNQINEAKMLNENDLNSSNGEMQISNLRTTNFDSPNIGNNYSREISPSQNLTFNPFNYSSSNIFSYNCDISNQFQDIINNDAISDAVSNNLQEILENMEILFGAEKNKIKKEKKNIIKLRDLFKQQLQKKITKFEREKDLYRKNISLAKNISSSQREIIDLDIGGSISISTTKKTLTKYPNSSLAIMFSGKYKLPYHNGKVFIDRDGPTFILLLQYLRNNTIPKFTNDIQKQNFYDEVDYWQIPLYKNIPQIKTPFIFDKEWCAETLRIEEGNLIVTKNNLQHGIIFCSPVMDDINSYIEFKVSIETPCKGKSHLFLGVVDKSKYKYENLLSTFWKDCPSSYYWDAWTTKLIKIDENGLQAGTMMQYGCQCKKRDIVFGIKYNAIEKTIEFTKNGKNFGVAFRDVQNGMTPSLDIWFESGKIEILNHSFSYEKKYL